MNVTRKMMKIVLGLTTLVAINIYITNAHASCFQQAARKIYKELIQSNKIKAPKLLISNSLVINAYATSDSITINQGMLEFLRNNAELAQVLGHELTHYNYGDYSSFWNSPSAEYRADKVGEHYAEQAGYNRCVGDKWMLRMYEQFGEMSSGFISGHPGNLERYMRLNKGCE